MVIEKQEEAIKSSQTKAMLLLEQANLLMEDSENVNLSRKRREFSNLLSNKLAKKLLESNVRIFILLKILIIMEMSNFVIYM